MDINLYQRDDLEKRIIINFGNYVFSQADISENLSFQQSVNTDGDFVIGVASCAQMDFDINNMAQKITDSDLAGREFTYWAGALTSSASKKAIYNMIGKDMVVLNGSIAYAGSGRAPYLSVWDLDESEMSGLPEQPPHPVKSLFLVDGKLYCGHDEAPYLTAYAVSGKELSKLSEISLNAFQIEQIQRFNKDMRASFLEGKLQREYRTKSVNGAVDFIEDTFEYNQISRMIADQVTRQNDNKLHVTSYDFMCKADKNIDKWTEGLLFPINALEYLKKLCVFLEIELAPPGFLNDDYVIQKSYRTQNITGRQAIQWVAQMAGCFAMMDEYGRLEIRWYRKRDYRIDEQSYTAISSESYITKPIDKLQISAVENDIGVVVPADDPTKTNTYIIQNNPLFYALTDAELRPTAQNLFDALKSFVYRPFSVSFIWGNPLLRAGDIVTVKSRKGQDFQAVVMSYKLTGVQALNGTMTATGGEVRETQADPVNQQIQALRMRSNQLVMDLEKTQNTLTTITTDIETVKDDITGLDKSVETITKEVGSLTLTSNSLVVSFDELKTDLDGVVQAQESHKLTFDKEGLTIYNGGFRINDGERDIFSVAADGSGVQMVGTFGTEYSYTTGQNHVETRGVWFKEGRLQFTSEGKDAAYFEVSKFSDGTNYVKTNAYFNQLHTSSVYAHGFYLWFDNGWRMMFPSLVGETDSAWDLKLSKDNYSGPDS